MIQKIILIKKIKEYKETSESNMEQIKMLKQQIKEKEGKNDNELINKNRELEKKILDKIEQIEGLRIALNKLTDEREEFIMKQSNKKNTLSKKSSKDNNELISNDTELKMELKESKIIIKNLTEKIKKLE